MELRELLAGADVVEIKGDAQIDISDLAYDSRGAGPGTLFFAIPGFTADGHQFAPLAVQAGASAVVVERELDLEPYVVQAIVGDARAAMGHAAARLYGGPPAGLRGAALAGATR